MSIRILDLNYNDPLLNDWGIYHLHLGNNLQPNGFVERTRDLLFVRITRTDAYFIAIGTHSDWTRKEMLEVIHRHWPESIKDYKMPDDVLGIDHSATEAEMKTFRKANLNFAVELSDSSIYQNIGGGSTTSGHSIQVVENTLDLKRMLNSAEDNVNIKRAELIAWFDSITEKDDSEYLLQLGQDDSGIFAKEKLTGVLLPIYQTA